MARQQTLTKFLTNPSRPSVLRSNKHTRRVLESDSPNAPANETDSDVPITHLMQNPASSCTVVSSSSRTRSASPAPIGSSLRDSLEPVKWKQKRKSSKVVTESDSEDELPHKRRRLLQRGLKLGVDDEDDKPDPACKDATRPA